MPSPWFRLYHEFADDPKVQMMPVAMQRHLVMLMCFRCKEVKLDEEQLAFYLRITPEELAATKVAFLARGFIDDDWNLLNWNKRQFISDSSTERTRDYREKKKQQRRGRERSETSQDRYSNDGHTGSETNGNVTTPSQHRRDGGDETKQNVTVTAPDTASEAEQKQRQKEARAAAAAFAKATAAKRNELVANAPLSFPPHPIVAGRAEEDDW